MLERWTSKRAFEVKWVRDRARVRRDGRVQRDCDATFIDGCEVRSDSFRVVPDEPDKLPPVLVPPELNHRRLLPALRMDPVDV